MHAGNEGYVSMNDNAILSTFMSYFSFHGPSEIVQCGDAYQQHGISGSNMFDSSGRRPNVNPKSLGEMLGIGSRQIRIWEYSEALVTLTLQRC